MWSINLVENTVNLTQECAEDLMKIETLYNVSWDPSYYGDEAWPTENFGKGGFLYFNEDCYEHMDYMWNKDVQAILLKHKVNGQIIFNSFEGDNKGQAWGHMFNDGVYTYLVGKAKTMKLKPVKK